MSKKRFTEGLDSFFDEQHQHVETLSGALLNEPPREGEEKQVRAKGKAHTKSFTTDLDTLLQEAFQESLQDIRDNKVDVKKTHAPEDQPETFHGLDSLIRSTLGLDKRRSAELFERSHLKKRITFTLDQDKLDKLKSIARLEKTYLKDIITRLLVEYISDYDKKKE